MTIENVNIVRTSHYQSMSDHPPAKRPYGGVPSEERQRQRHDKLIDAGIRIFGSKGFHGATVREICVEAHLTERYFYESFKNMSELFIAVYSQVRQELMDQTKTALRHAKPAPDDLLEASLRVFLEFIRNDPYRARIFLIEALSIGRGVIHVSGETAREYSNLLLKFIHNMYPDAERFGVRLDLMTAGLIGMNIHLATRWVNEQFATPIDVVLRSNMLPYHGLLALLKQGLPDKA